MQGGVGPSDIQGPSECGGPRVADRGCSVLGLNQKPQTGAQRPADVSRMFLEQWPQQDGRPQSLERSVSAPSGEVCDGSSRLKLASLGLKPPLHLEVLLKWGRLWAPCLTQPPSPARSLTSWHRVRVRVRVLS